MTDPTKETVLWQGAPDPQPRDTHDFTIEAVLGVAVLALLAGRWEQGLPLWVAVLPGLLLAGWVLFRLRFLPVRRAQIHYTLTTRHAVFEDRGERKVFRAVPVTPETQVSLSKAFGDNPSVIFGQPRLRSYRRRTVSRRNYLENFLFIEDAPEAYRLLGEMRSEAGS